ncbi:MAG TPA: YdcH family protein [Dokdonella sp.]|uniref:YdcH family protein n=1 Tax=Dokdonella sp. TaxID=2291710 RepID=UPI002D7EB35D|nr:YdcH family protein [Dokdonella sp.]HET9034516.1 YdcH family protein [Dokdonella sp.]
MFEQAQREDLESLMQDNTEFRQLYHKHRKLDSKVRDAELGVLPIDVVTLQTMKKEKLLAKDKLTHMWANMHDSSAH